MALLGLGGTGKENAEMPINALASRETASCPLALPVRRYELTTAGGSEVLMRVIGLVRRRCGEVVALEFRCGERHPGWSAPAELPMVRRATGCSAPAELPMARRATATPSVLELAVAIDPRHGSSLSLRLAGLIDVMAVREY